MALCGVVTYIYYGTSSDCCVSKDKLVTYANETLENGERGASSDLFVFVSVLISNSEYGYVHMYARYTDTEPRYP